MLILPKDQTDETVNIIGIDPGTSFIGLAILTIDIKSLLIKNSTAFTIDASRLINDNSLLSQLYGNRFSRINALENELINIFNFYNPLLIYAESPFFGLRHPNAFQALTEVICSIRNTVYKFDQWKTLNLVSPSEVKQAVFSKGNANKMEMKHSVSMILNEIKYNQSKPFDDLDEHSIDSLAVAFYAYKKLISRDDMYHS